MRVLILHNRYREPGGEDSVVAAEAELLERGGHRVHLHQVENPAGGIAALGNLARAAWNPAVASEVQELSARFRPDVMHVHNTWFSASLAPLWSVRRQPVARVMTLHNYRALCIEAGLYREGGRCTECVGRGPWRGVVHRCYRNSVGASLVAATNVTLHRSIGTWPNQVDAFIAPTALSRELLVRGGLPADLITVKPHFVSDPGPRADRPSHAAVVLYAGRLSADKGLLPLVRAWSADPPAGLELWFIGDGELRDDIAASGPSVRVMPWLTRAELRELMATARAVVVPTAMYETFGLTALEAMAAGTPVLTVAGTAVAEVVGDGGPTPVPPMASAPEWAAALRTLTGDSSVDIWGAAARTRFEHHFSPDAALDRLIAVYRAAARVRASRSA